MKWDDKYRDLLHRTPPRAEKPMARASRAAQFAPFAALVGHDAAVAETARVTDRRIELSEETQRELNAKQAALKNHLHERPVIAVTYFVPDTQKEGGAYAVYRGALRRVDETARLLWFTDGMTIPMDDVCDIACEKRFTFPVENDMME